MENQFSLWHEGATVIQLVLLTILSAGFSACETAFVAASRARLHMASKAGNKRAEKVLELKSKMSLLISSILLCNTLINILASAIATRFFIVMFGEVGVVYATMVMGVLLVVYAEVIPKIIGIRQPERFTMMLCPLIKAVVVVCSPLTLALNRYAHWNMRLVGIQPATSMEKSETAEELRGIIDLYGQANVEKRDEQNMLQSIMDLGDVCVEEVMIHRKNMFSINAGGNAEDILSQLLKCPYTRVPLWRDDPDNIVGILHVKSFMRALVSEKNNLAKVDVINLAMKPWFVPETRTLLNQMQAFRRRREHVALVVDEYGELQGLITLEDILEEIVGDITDETDVELTYMHVNPKGELFVEGHTTIRDLNRQYNLDLDDTHASTLAGLLMEEARQIPELGQTFVLGDVEITVLRKVGNQVTYLKIISHSQKPLSDSK